MALIPSDISITLLNVGTAVLVKDVMDQHLRTIGDVKTFYASNLKFALEAYSEKHIDIIFCEVSFEGGTAEEFVRRIGGLDTTDRLYLVLATDEDSEKARALQEELGADAILRQPFSTLEVEGEILKAVEKKTKEFEGWVDDLLEAKLAHKNKRMQEAGELYLDLLKTHKDNVDIIRAAASYYLEIPKLEQAERLISLLLDKNPFDLKALSLKSQLLLKQNNFLDAIKTLETLQKKSPLNSDRANSLVSAYIHCSIETLRKSQRVTTTNTSVNLNLIKILVVAGRYKDAVSAYERHRKTFLGAEKKEAEYFLAIAKKLGAIA